MEEHILPANTFRTLLNRVLTITDKVKMDINPMFCALRIKDDKAYVFNGETGIIQYLPFLLKDEISFQPFSLKSVAKAMEETDVVKLQFDATKLAVQAICPSLKIKIKAFPKAEWRGKEVPDKFDVEGSYPGLLEKIKKAKAFTHFDASLPLLQGIRIKETYLCATDQRGLYVDHGDFSGLDIVIPELLANNMIQLGLEPIKIGIVGNLIFAFYTDLILYGFRLADDTTYPSAYPAYQDISSADNSAEIQYDQGALAKTIERLLEVSENEVVKFEVEKGLLKIGNMIEGADETQGTSELPCICDVDSVPPIVVNGNLLLKAVGVAGTMEVKADNQRLTFQNPEKTTFFGMGRRAMAGPQQ